MHTNNRIRSSSLRNHPSWLRLKLPQKPSLEWLQHLMMLPLAFLRSMIVMFWTLVHILWARRSQLRHLWETGRRKIHKVGNLHIPINIMHSSNKLKIRIIIIPQFKVNQLNLKIKLLKMSIAKNTKLINLIQHGILLMLQRTWILLIVIQKIKFQNWPKSSPFSHCHISRSKVAIHFRNVYRSINQHFLAK